MTLGAIIFDLDGTLCNTRYLAAGLIRYRFHKLTRMPRAIIYLIVQTTMLLSWKLGFLTYSRIVQASAPEFARLLKGFNKTVIPRKVRQNAKFNLGIVR